MFKLCSQTPCLSNYLGIQTPHNPFSLPLCSMPHRPCLFLCHHRFVSVQRRHTIHEEQRPPPFHEFLWTYFDGGERLKDEAEAGPTEEYR
ncbi:hypothetical protein C1H46_024791 [Malus baccata]|uniref:Uncharacterized protein n=1 Tax=Malus baccata TaxID=106549 RepID=A0A540LTC2_MALBA|nr:hypothetical protein C1H46_024791 [Malus baccata]